MRKLEIRSSFLCLSPLLILPHPILCSTFAVAFGCIAWEAKDPHHKAGKQGRQKRKTSAANLQKKHYYMPCKKRFFRLSSSYLYFFHILTIMCCQNKIFPRLRPFPVEHTGGVSSCSTGKRKPAGHGRRGRSLPAQYSWISRKRDGEENVGQRGAPHTGIPVPTSVKDSESSVLPVCTFENTRRPSAVVPPGHKSHSFAQVRLIVNILSTQCCIS